MSISSNSENTTEANATSPAAPQPGPDPTNMAVSEEAVKKSSEAVKASEELEQTAEAEVEKSSGVVAASEDAVKKSSEVVKESEQMEKKAEESKGL
jgi:hypothetical protein